MDPIGRSQVWYRWVFYNDDARCNQEVTPNSADLTNTCLDKSPIDGELVPNTYSTYFSWNDFYDKDDIYTFLYIMLATSFFSVIGLPANMVFSLCFQGYMIFNGWLGY